MKHQNGISSECRTFFVGERLSLADISLACSLILLFEKGLDCQQRAPFVHLIRWFTTIVNQRIVKAGLSDITESFSCHSLGFKI